MKVSELAGAELDYWVARAEGIPAEQLSIRWLPGMGSENCIYQERAMPFSIVWSYGGPLMDKYLLGCAFDRPGVWIAVRATGPLYDTSFWSMARSEGEDSEGSTALEAICRAVVRAKFGDEVDGIRESAAHLSAQS